MTPKRRQRLLLVTLMIAGVGVATALGVTAFRENIMLFHSPAEVARGAVDEGRRFRIGGMVVEGSVARQGDGLDVRFDLTDTAASVPVIYTGILPDLFREGQGIVAMGSLDASGVFVATEVLAKHDENYMPPEVAESLERAGRMPGTDAVIHSRTVAEP